MLDAPAWRSTGKRCSSAKALKLVCLSASWARGTARCGDAWSLGLAGRIGCLDILDLVDALGIVRENCKTSFREADACARRWAVAGRRGRSTTSTIGKDSNDALLAKQGIAK